MIYGRNLFDQPVKNDVRTYDWIRKRTQSAAYCIFTISKSILRWEQRLRALDADPKSKQQINFTGNIKPVGYVIMFFILDEINETI